MGTARVAHAIQPPRRNPGAPTGAMARFADVRVMFWIYVTGITSGLVYFTVIGLTHH
jgi:hypothetical protein